MRNQGKARLVAGRELTKAFEEIVTGSTEDVIAYFDSKDKIKGEFAVIVIPEAGDDSSEEDTDA